jgi:hypothetical protein
MDEYYRDAEGHYRLKKLPKRKRRSFSAKARLS